MSKTKDFFVDIDDKIDTDKTDNIDQVDDKIDIDKTDDIDYFDKDIIDNDKPHNGKPITKIEVSPDESYLVTYSEEDLSIVGWNVEERLKQESSIEVSNGVGLICVSNDKKLVYIDEDRKYLGK
jgi:hypothetical protein